MTPHLDDLVVMTAPTRATPTQELSVTRKRHAEPGVPRHLAIVLNGHGRWATARGLPRLAGYERGLEVVRESVVVALEGGVEHLSLYAFGALKEQGSNEDVPGLLDLYQQYLDHEARRMADQGVRLRHLGDRPQLPAEVLQALEAAEARTASGTRMTLHMAVNYSAREEIVQAVKALAVEVAAGRLPAEGIDATRLASQLCTAGAPPVDLLVRTAGERRISDFLLWQAAYAELLFLDVLWPDFTRTHMHGALDAFALRKRTFGGLVDCAEPGAA